MEDHYSMNYPTDNEINISQENSVRYGEDTYCSEMNQSKLNLLRFESKNSNNSEKSFLKIKLFDIDSSKIHQFTPTKDATHSPTFDNSPNFEDNRSSSTKYNRPIKTIDHKVLQNEIANVEDFYESYTNNKLEKRIENFEKKNIDQKKIEEIEKKYKILELEYKINKLEYEERSPKDKRYTLSQPNAVGMFRDLRNIAKLIAR